MLLEVVKKVLRPLVRRIREKKRINLARQVLEYDQERFCKYSGSFNYASKEVLLAQIIMAYHVLEKGLTMPKRKMGFGKAAVDGLIRLVKNYETKFGTNNAQVNHASSCVIAYAELHSTKDYDKTEDVEFW